MREVAQTEPIEPLISQREVLAILGVARPTLFNWRKRGVFPQPLKIGPRHLLRWRREAVEDFIEKAGV